MLPWLPKWQKGLEEDAVKEQEIKRAPEEAKESRKGNREVDLGLGVEEHQRVQIPCIMHHNKIDLMEISIVGKGRLVLEMHLDLLLKVTNRTKGSKVDLVKGGKHRTRGGPEWL